MARYGMLCNSCYEVTDCYELVMDKPWWWRLRCHCCQKRVTGWYHLVTRTVVDKAIRVRLGATRETEVP